MSVKSTLEKVKIFKIALLILVLLTGVIITGFHNPSTSNLQATNLDRPSSNNDGPQAIAVTPNGSRIVATYDQGIYESTNKGKSWKASVFPKAVGAWGGFATNSDGNRQVLVNHGCFYAYPQFAAGDIYLSSNSGTSWSIAKSAGKQAWNSVASDSSGRTLIATTDAFCTGQNVDLGEQKNLVFGALFLSHDYGKTWVRSRDHLVKDCSSSVSNSTGKILVLSCDAGIVISRDAGMSWKVSRPLMKTNPYSSVVISSSGKYIYAIENGLPKVDLIWSRDFGFTWQKFSIPGIHSWSSLTTSQGGRSIIAVDEGGFDYGKQIQYQGYVYQSSDFGLHWRIVQTGSPKLWSKIVLSGDGSTLIGVKNQELVTSSDGGKTWTVQNNELSRQWQNLTMGSDGSFLIASSYYPGGDGGDPEHEFFDWFISSDFGEKWVGRGVDSGASNIATTDPNFFLGDIITDSSGSIMYGTTGILEKIVYRSTDFGRTWVQQPFSISTTYYWSNKISLSSDGTNVAYLDDTDHVFASSDSGTHWSNRTPAGLGSGDGTQDTISLSADGTRLVVDTGSGIYTSSDFGRSWLRGIKPWSSLASGLCQSADGKFVAVSADSIYTSTNYGKSFTQEPIAGITKLGKVVCSNSGQYLAVPDSNWLGRNSGYIYLSRDFGKSWSASPSAGKLEWWKVNISSDGKRFAALGTVTPDWQAGMHIFLSNDGGKSWIDDSLSATAKWVSD